VTCCRSATARSIPLCTNSNRKAGFTAEWKLSENNRRAKYYRLTPRAAGNWNREAANWDRLASAISHVVKLKEGSPMRLERWLYTVPLRFRSLFRRAIVEQELDEELRYHIERLTEEHIARGVSPREARLAALRAMRGVEQRKEECRDARRVGVVEDALQDVRFGVRTLLRLPGFTLAAILTLALGIGATVAVFTIVNGVLVRPLSFPDADRLFPRRAFAARALRAAAQPLGP
jgi:hypothetical protein